MGSLDKAIRLLIAIVFAALYITKTVQGTFGLILIVGGGILLLTSILSFCPLYSLLGFSSSRKK